MASVVGRTAGESPPLLFVAERNAEAFLHEGLNLYDELLKGSRNKRLDLE
ncbi:MAG TPA: hypothetical protein VF552_06015 [Allosphingosinicella sp.]|jgi:hypothetical protein